MTERPPEFDPVGAPVPTAGIFHDVARKAFNADPGAIRRLNLMIRTDDYHVVHIPVFRLVATQASVNGDYREAPRRYGAGDHDLPAVVRYEGRHYVTDGHHRIMALTAGSTSLARVRLFDLDGDLQCDVPLFSHEDSFAPRAP